MSHSSDANRSDPSEDRPAEGSDAPNRRGSGASVELTDTVPDRRSMEETRPADAEGASRLAETGEFEPEVVDDRYAVRSLLGRGSMGNVYKVFDRELEEIVALKTLHREFVEEEELEARFRREVKLARRVTHRNVARIYDLGLQDEIPYLTMEYIAGEPFDEILERRGALNADEVHEFVDPICRGLEAIHEAEIVHRDLKPQNIMVGDRVAITDFGIARAAPQSSHFSISQEGLIGTPAYMAPEQVRNAAKIDARTDIYALGVMLYRMLTGTFPWNATSPVAMAFERCERPPPELPEDGDWPDGYREVVHRCLAKEPERRFGRPTAVAAELRRTSNSAFSTYNAEELPSDRGDSTFEAALGRPRMGEGVGLESLPAGKTVAVLPFEYAGPEDLEYRAVGFTEELLDELSRQDGLAVLPRGAVQHFAGDDVAPRSAGEQLGVQVVVAGSVRQLDETVRVRVSAVSVQEGFQLWAERFEGDATDLLEVGAEAADAVSDALTVETRQTAHSAPSDPQAVDLYMRARHQLYERWFSDLDPVIELFERAVEREPEDPRILSGFATARARAAFVDPDRRREHLDEAERLANRAIEIAPGWPEPHFALAKVYYNRVEFGLALDAVERALEITSEFAEAHGLRGRILAEIGPLEMAADHLDRATDLNAFSYNARWDLARVRALRGEWHEVDRLLERPVDSDLHTVLRFANRCRFDVWRDDPQWIYAHPPEELPRGSDFERLTPVMRRVARGESLVADDSEALEAADGGSGSDSRYYSLQCQFRAEIGTQAGELEYALDALEEAVATGLVDRNWLEHCPALDPLRGDSKFRRVVERVETRIERQLD